MKLIFLLFVAACAARHAPELQVARAAILKAEKDLASDRAGLAEARATLREAEALDERRPGVIEARDLAYIAALRAMRAEVDGRAAVIEQKLERASEERNDNRAKRVSPKE